MQPLAPDFGRENSDYLQEKHSRRFPTALPCFPYGAPFPSPLRPVRFPTAPPYVPYGAPMFSLRRPLPFRGRAAVDLGPARTAEAATNRDYRSSKNGRFAGKTSRTPGPGSPRGRRSCGPHEIRRTCRPERVREATFPKTLPFLSPRRSHSAADARQKADRRSRSHGTFSPRRSHCFPIPLRFRPPRSVGRRRAIRPHH